MLDTAHLTTATPAEIDTEIARLQHEMSRHNATEARHQDFIEQWESVQGTYQADYPWFSQDKIDAARTGAAAAAEARQSLIAQAQPLLAEFARRGGWSRFYLVTNTGGHVHNTTACSTCFPTTEFAWLTEYSGMSNEDFVQEAGSKACTVCFPDAPVQVYSRATRIKYESHEARERREERERKAAEKAAAEVRVEGYNNGYGSTSTVKVFKTVRAVTNDIASNLSSLAWYGVGHPTATEWLGNIEACRKALADKGAEYDYDKALAAARKKVTREGGNPKF